jgi:hypothetical protein
MGKAARIDDDEINPILFCFLNAVYSLAFMVALKGTQQDSSVFCLGF